MYRLEEIGELVELFHAFDSFQHSSNHTFQVGYTHVSAYTSMKLIPNAQIGFRRWLCRVLGAAKHTLQVSTLEPIQLVLVDNAAGPIYVLQREPLDQLIQGEHLLVRVRRTPAEQTHKVHHCLRSVVVHVILYVPVTVALAQLGTILVEKQWKMCKLRCGPAKHLVEDEVLHGGHDPFLTTNHVRDSHQMIVDYRGQMIGWQSVGLEQHLVVDLIVLKEDRSTDMIPKSCLTRWNLHAHSIGNTLLKVILHFLTGECEASSVVHRPIAVCVCSTEAHPL
mmetsp:Transcript_35942/g.90171  ORF Transcript_35942/g.90171 Transcript_35942/m.90171 type:complete len:279 (-) Transcript_35942:195-1031(-)